MEISFFYLIASLFVSDYKTESFRIKFLLHNEQIERATRNTKHFLLCITDCPQK